MIKKKEMNMSLKPYLDGIIICHQWLQLAESMGEVEGPEAQMYRRLMQDAIAQYDKMKAAANKI